MSVLANLRCAFLAFAASVLASSAAQAAGCPTGSGDAVAVAKVIDGDTVRLADGLMVRLAAVEAPKRPLAVTDGPAAVVGRQDCNRRDSRRRA